jgi:hypothetical protein
MVRKSLSVSDSLGTPENKPMSSPSEVTGQVAASTVNGAANEPLIVASTEDPKKDNAVPESPSSEEAKPSEAQAQKQTSLLPDLDRPKPASDFKSFFMTTKAEEGKVKTDYLNLPKNEGGDNISNRLPSPGTMRLSSNWRLRWRIGEETVIMAVEDRVVIGRAMEGDTSIGFDLTPHGAYHFGVSRMHAIMTMNDGFLYLEDLNSTNGTRINGFQVTPKQKYRLRDGDEIEFARLRTTIKFENPNK